MGQRSISQGLLPLAMVTLFVCAGALGAAENLLTNPGFEKELGAAGLPEGWTFGLHSWSGSKGTINWETDVCRSGGHSVKIAQTNDAGKMDLKSLMVPVKPSVKYAFSGWMKTEFKAGTGQAAYFFLVGYKAGNVVKQLQNTTIAKTTTDWTEYRIDTSFGGDIDAVTIHAVLCPGPGTVWVDDVSFSEVTPETAAPAGEVKGSLLDNGDFENDAEGDGIPDKWRSSDPNTATWSTEFAASGKRSIRIAKSGYWIQSSLPILPGRKLCKVSFNVITDKFGETYKVYCETAKDNRAGFLLAQLADRGEGMRTWHKKEFTFRMPDPGAADSFYLVLTVVEGTVWYDDVRMEVVAEEAGREAERNPLEIDLTTPYWRNTIYATETSPSIKGEVVFNTEHPGGACVVEIKTSDGKSFATKNVKCASTDTSSAFEFAAEGLPLGDHAITATFRGADGKEMLASAMLRRVGPSAGEIRVREDNVLLINGKPFFPIGLWPGLPSGPSGEIAAAGFNWVCGGNPDVRVPSAYTAEIKSLEEYGLKCGVELHIYTALKNSQETAESIQRGIPNVKGNATFLGWYVDEAVLAGLPTEYARTCYEAVIKNDPNHLLWTSHAPRNTIAEIAAWNKYMDLTWCNIYPYPDVQHSDLPNTTISVVGDETVKQRKTVNDRKPVWMNLQGYIWENRPEPTWQATRFMAYDAIINGAKGIIFYNTHTIPRPGTFWSSIKRTAGQIRDISAVLVSPDVKTALKVDCPYPDQIRYLLKKCEGNVYLLAENRSDKAFSVNMSGVPVTQAALDVVFEDRKVLLADGTLRDTFAPYDIHIYTDAKALPTPLVPTTPAALQYARDEERLAQLIEEGRLSRTWDAEWIWYPGQLQTENLVVYARKVIHLDSKPKTAWFQLAVDDGFVLYLNGKQVNVKEQGWSRAYEVAQYLDKGDNVIGIKGINGTSYAGILLQGVIEAGADRKRVISDSSWKISLTPDAGWPNRLFDDAAWQNAYAIGKPPVPPWRTVSVYLSSVVE